VYVGAILVLLAIAVYIYPFDSTLYVNGGKDAIGAQILIDGILVDKMRSFAHGADATISLRPGDHKITIISLMGQTFEKDFSIQGEYYIVVVFNDSTK